MLLLSSLSLSLSLVHSRGSVFCLLTLASLPLSLLQLYSHSETVTVSEGDRVESLMTAWTVIVLSLAGVRVCVSGKARFAGQQQSILNACSLIHCVRAFSTHDATAAGQKRSSGSCLSPRVVSVSLLQPLRQS